MSISEAADTLSQHEVHIEEMRDRGELRAVGDDQVAIYDVYEFLGFYTDMREAGILLSDLRDPEVPRDRHLKQRTNDLSEEIINEILFIDDVEPSHWEWERAIHLRTLVTVSRILLAHGGDMLTPENESRLLVAVATAI